MSIDLVITNLVWLGKKTNLLLSQGKIRELTPVLPTIGDGTKVRDGQGYVLLPSLIDAHVHLREPGYEYKEEINTGLKAALGGGFGQVMAMANTNPVNDQASVTSFMLEKAKSFGGYPYLRPIGALTKGLAGKEMAPLAELKDAGCVAFSNDGLPVLNNELFRRCLEYSSDLGLKVIDHCEDPFLAEKGVINEGKLSSFLGLKGVPTVAESLQVARDILLAAYLDVPIHLAHVSCAQSVELIAWAKQKGIPISAETCLHYLLLTEEACNDYNTLAKVNPPLRTQEDQMALVDGLKSGVIDILVTDHAPHADFEKDVPFAEAPNGISGLDTALSLSLELLKQGFCWQDLIDLWGTKPAQIFNLPFSTLEPGSEANFILVDPDYTWKVTAKNMFSKGKNTPWLNQILQGKVIVHFYQGKEVFNLKQEIAGF